MVIQNGQDKIRCWVNLGMAVVLMTCIGLSKSANILSFTPYPSHSHFVIVESVLIGLANRGHNITAVTFFPQKKPHKNINDIDISKSLTLLTGNITEEYVMSTFRPPHKLIDFIMSYSHSNCEVVVKDKAFQDLIKDSENNRFDLVIIELFGSDCFGAFAHKFNCPLVTVSTTLGLPWVATRFGNPDNPTYIPSYFSKHPDRMNLYDRLYNTAVTTLSNIAYPYYSEVPAQKLMEGFFGEKLPPIAEILRNTSLVLANTHNSFRSVQPNLPNFVEIGGIHLKEPKPLPKEIQELMDGAPNGVVIVSLGSMIRCSTLPKEKLKVFINAFNKLPYRILWKVEDDLPGLAKNVIIRKWFPIKDILDHPNIKLIFMHGGMATTIEAVNAGVPVVGLPMFGDQFGNVNSLEHRGAGVALDYFDITEKSLYNAIYKVATDISYKENMKKLSILFKDREHSPLETAMFWVEYVLRHKGAPHLQSPVTSLSWYQFMLLDVISIILLSIVMSIGLLYFIFKTIANLIFTKDKKRKRS